MVAVSLKKKKYEGTPYRLREEVEILKDVAGVAKVGGLVVTRKGAYENEEGVITSKKLEDIESPDELIEVTSLGC